MKPIVRPLLVTAGLAVLGLALVGYRIAATDSVVTLTATSGSSCTPLSGPLQGQQICAPPRPSIPASATGTGTAISAAEIAQALGITVNELASDAREGKTVKDIAAAKSIDRTTFFDNLRKLVKSDLDQQVARARITQAEEDSFLSSFSSNTDFIWNSSTDPQLSITDPSPPAAPSLSGGFRTPSAPPLPSAPKLPG
jgi:hypothetical protein